MVVLASQRPNLPLLGDVKHHDHPVTVLVHVQELCVQGHLRLRLGTGRKRHESVFQVGSPRWVPTSGKGWTGLLPSEKIPAYLILEKNT